MEKPYNYQSEPGIEDATYQDFVAPLVMGLGVGSRLLSKAPAMAETFAPAATAAGKASEPFRMDRATAESMLARFADKAQEIGDFARVLKYKALRSAMEQSQMSAADILDKIMKIHADVNPIASGLNKE